MEGYTQISYSELFKTVFDQQTQSVSYGLLILAVFGLALITHSICLYLDKTKKRKVKAFDEIIIIAILAYVCVLLSITFFNREEGSRGTIKLDMTVTRTLITSFIDFFTKPSKLPLTKQLLINLTNAKALTSSVYYVLNILLFIPWGFILSIAHYKEGLFKAFIMPSIYSIIISGFIEITQLITGRGFFEIEDLITNIIGGILGALLAVIIQLIVRLIKNTRNKNARNKNGGEYGFEEE